MAGLLFGIALVNSSALPASGFIIYPAQPGPGGNLGPGGQNNAAGKGANGQAGSNGFSDSIVSFTSTNRLAGAGQ